jgi:hypothetical protein
MNRKPQKYKFHVHLPGCSWRDAASIASDRDPETLPYPSFMKRTLLLTAITVFLIPSLFAQDKSGNLNDVAKTALNPIAQVVKLQIQPNYYMYYGGGNALNLMTRLIIPYNDIIIPGVKSPKNSIFTIARIEFPVTSQTYGSEPELNATGLADMTLGDALCFKTSWGKWGVGFNAGFPTATMPVLGSGKWTIGPTAILFYNKPKHVMLGMVVNQYFSYAGSPSRPAVNYMNIQPFIDVIFNKGYFIMINPIFNLDWQNGNYTFPVGLGFGKAFAKNLSCFIMPEYVISGPTKNTFIIQFNLNGMF